MRAGRVVVTMQGLGGGGRSGVWGARWETHSGQHRHCRRSSSMSLHSCGCGAGLLQRLPIATRRLFEQAAARRPASFELAVVRSCRRVPSSPLGERPARRVVIISASSELAVRRASPPPDPDCTAVGPHHGAILGLLLPSLCSLWSFHKPRWHGTPTTRSRQRRQKVGQPRRNRSKDRVLTSACGCQAPASRVVRGCLGLAPCRRALRRGPRLAHGL